MAKDKHNGRPAKPSGPSVKVRRGVFALPNKMTIAVVVPETHELDAENCYAVATALAKVAKEYVEAGDAKNPSPFFAGVDCSVVVIPEAREGVPAGCAFVGVVKGIDAQGLRDVEFPMHVGDLKRRAWFRVDELGEPV